MQERKMTKKEKGKEKRLKKKYDDSGMKASMKKQYGKDWKAVYYATIRKRAMEAFGKFTKPSLSTTDVSTVDDKPQKLGLYNPAELAKEAPAIVDFNKQVRPRDMEYKSMYIGPNSKTWDEGRKKKAEEMESQGASRDEIWKETGTIRGPEGAWRQEISDHNARWKVDWKDGIQYGNLDFSNITARSLNGQKYYKLKDVLDHPELFKAYPELKNMDIFFFDNSANPNERAFYMPGGDIVGLGIASYQNPGELADMYKETMLDLVHEIQHGIQEREPEFAQGGNSNAAKTTRILDNIDRFVYTDAILGAYEVYYSYGGEAMSRDTEDRREYDEYERYKNTPEFGNDTPLITVPGSSVPQWIADNPNYQGAVFHDNDVTYINPNFDPDESYLGTAGEATYTGPAIIKPELRPDPKKPEPEKPKPQPVKPKPEPVIVQPTKPADDYRTQPYGFKKDQPKQISKSNNQRKAAMQPESKTNEGYQILPAIDKERYTEIPGMEGPFMTRSGKVVYYDPQEGSYYDRDKDMYLSYDEWKELDEDSNMKTAIDDIVAQVVAQDQKRSTSPRPKIRPDDFPRTRPRARPKGINIGSNPRTGATRGIDPRDNYSPEDLKRLLMQSAYARMDESARGLGSIDWPDTDEDGDSAMMQHAENAIRHGMHAYDAYDHVYSMSRERDWLSDNKDMIIDMFAQYGLATEDVTEAKYGPDEVEQLLSNAEEVFFHQKEGGASDQEARWAAHNELKADAEEMGMGDRERKELHQELEAELVRQMNMMDFPREGHSPHKKGTAKYKKHMAAMHANSAEPEGKMIEGVKRNILYREIGKRLAKGHSIDRIKKYYKDIDAKYPGHIEKIVQALKDRNEIPEASMNEGEEKPYICVHAKKGKHECRAESSYAAAKKAAAHWGLKSTAGIDAHLAIDEGKYGKKKKKKYETIDISKVKAAVNMQEGSDTEAVAEYIHRNINESHDTWEKVNQEVHHVIGKLTEGHTAIAGEVYKNLHNRHMQEYFDAEMSIKENVSKLRKIVQDKSAMPVKFEDGSMKIDMTTANIFLQAFDAQREETQAKIIDTIRTKAGFLKMMEIIYGKLK
jgi:hypothetical protein